MHDEYWNADTKTKSTSDCTTQLWSHFQSKCPQHGLWSLRLSVEAASPVREIIHNGNLQMCPRQTSQTFRVSLDGFQSLGFRLVPVFPQTLLPRPPLGFVFVHQLGLQRRRILQLVPGLVVLPGVPLALARRDHGDLVHSGAAVLALQPDALGAGFVVDAPPVVVPVPAGPELPAVGPAADPVLEHLGWETLARAHQLLDGVDAGAVAVRDVLGGPQLSAADLATICGETGRKGRE